MANWINTKFISSGEKLSGNTRANVFYVSHANRTYYVVTKVSHGSLNDLVDIFNAAINSAKRNSIPFNNNVVWCTLTFNSTQAPSLIQSANLPEFIVNYDPNDLHSVQNVNWSGYPLNQNIAQQIISFIVGSGVNF